MRYFDDLFIWENINNVKQLRKFRKLVISYFTSVEYTRHGYKETSSSISLRENINLMIPKINVIMRQAHVSPSLLHRNPPAIGGGSTYINVVENIFNLHHFMGLGKEDVVDFVDKAIGVYLADQTKAKIRSLNPFFYLHLIIITIIKLPFFVIEKAGFNREKVESSIPGKIFTTIGTLLAYIWTLIQISEKLGFLTTIKSFLGLP